MARRGGWVLGSLLAWWLLAATLEHGAPPGVVLRGSIVGGLYALGAVGIVLVWRGTGIINFAQAELGALSGVVAVQLATQLHVPYLVAVGAGLLTAAVLGWAVDAVVIRRLRHAPRLIVTVATIGVAQLVAGAALLLPLLGDGQGDGTFEVPFDLAFTLDPIVFDGNHVLVLIAVPVLLLGLAWFLRSTSFGIGIRAAADNDDRASLLGVPTRRLSGIVWSSAAVLSAAAVLLRIPLVGFVASASVSGGGNALLLRILAAAVLARMEKLPVAVAAAVAIGILEEVASAELSNTNAVDALLVVVILGALLLQRDRFRRSAETGIGSWRAVREARSVPAELADLPLVRNGQRVLRWSLLGIALALPLWLSPSQEQAAGLALLYAVVAVSMLVLTGWSGQISLGQFALVGIGGCTTGILYSRHGWDYLLAGPAGVAAAAAVAVVIGLPALRVRGPFLAVSTLAFAVTASTYLFDERTLPWFVPTAVAPPVVWERWDLASRPAQYELCLLALLIAIAVAGSLRASRTGRALLAVRDNEAAAATVTINPVATKLLGFAVSGALAGLAGSVYVVTQGGIFADAFDAEVSIRLFSMVVIGGLATTAGVVLGAFYVRGAEFFLPHQWALVASGVGIVALVLLLPEGLGGLLYRARDASLRAVARWKGIHVPSLLEDRRLDAAADADAAPRPSAEVRADPTDGVGPPPLLRLRGVDVSYGQTQVLFGVDLDVAEGEILALLGTNGAGKSTILRAVSGLSTPSAGRIALDGTDITHLEPGATLRLGIAQVPGGRGVFPSLTVAENLRVAAWSVPPSQHHEDLEQCLDWFPALRTRSRTQAGAMSGGEQQMLSLAMAFLSRPRLLLIDELSLGLAPSVVERLLEIVREVHARGSTIVLVEQSVDLALRLADRAVFLEKGEVRFEGPTAELLERTDLLRAVYLKGSAAAGGDAPSTGRRRTRALRPASHVDAAPVLRAEGLTKRYGGLIALDDVSFELRAGELLGIVGPNGAGKTTLFDVLTGFVRPDAGLVHLGERDVTRRAAHDRARLGLGRSFQDARLWQSLTVRDCLAVACERTIASRNPIAAVLDLPIEQISARAVDERVEQLIDGVGLGAFADKFLGELSTGSRRMVEIGGLLANGATTLLLDEPSSGIAQGEAEALGPVLLDIRTKLGASIVVIEHDMPLLTGIADRLVALDAGAVVTSGACDDVLSHPDVVAAYLGARA